MYGQDHGHGGLVTRSLHRTGAQANQPSEVQRISPKHIQNKQDRAKEKGDTHAYRIVARSPVGGWNLFTLREAGQQAHCDAPASRAPGPTRSSAESGEPGSNNSAMR